MRSVNSRAAFTPAPPIRDPSVLLSHQFRPNHLENIKSPTDFLKAIGRSSETKISVESWEEFWKKDGLLLKKDGVPVRDRRYGLDLELKESCTGLCSYHSGSDIFCGAWKNIA